MAEVLRVQTEDFSMDYMKFGNGGKTLVILPGLGSSSVMPLKDLIAEAYGIFADDYTCYLFERINELYDGYSISEMADDTAVVIRKLGLKDIYLFGASQGGMMAQLFAARNADIIKKLVIVSSMPKSNLTIEKVFMNCIDLGAKGKYSEMSHYLNTHVYSKEYYKKYSEAFSNSENRETEDGYIRLKSLMNACLSFDATMEHKNISCPTFIVGSKKDRVLTGEASEELAQILDSELYLYDEYGHAVYDEAPDFKQKVFDFLKK